MQAFRTVHFEREKDAPRVRQTHRSPQLKLEYLQEIIKDKASSQIDGAVIDVCSAEIVLQVYSRVGKGLQRRLLAMPVERLVGICSKLMDR
jgi:hypothetical protein